MKKNCKKANQREFRTEKVIKRKSDKLYVKWKDSDNCFNNWIDKKRHSTNERIISRGGIFRKSES